VKPAYESCVFINCPFDTGYKPIFEALVFTIFDAGFVPRCAMEVNDGAQNRLDKIMAIIRDCKYGIHDISRTEPDPIHNLPRFNMPFELGLYFGCKNFGVNKQKRKACLVMDQEQHRYQKFISDIAGTDIAEHKGDREIASRRVRDWLRTTSLRSNIPGPRIIWNRFDRFSKQLPTMCEKLGIDIDDIPFVEHSHLISEWLKLNALPVVQITV
jgi:hypothetical protein